MTLTQRRLVEELEHKLDIEKRKQRERVKVINQQQIAMKEEHCRACICRTVLMLLHHCQLQQELQIAQAQCEEAMKEYIKDK